MTRGRDGKAEVHDRKVAKQIAEAIEGGAVLLPEPVRRASDIMCGCGCNEAAWTWIRDWLASREGNPRPPDPAHPPEGGEEDGGRWLLVYLMDHLGLTEHGCRITNCWLTEDGQALLDFLRRWGPDWAEKAWWVDSTGCSIVPEGWTFPAEAPAS
jgi:hypothetical protein